MFCITLLVFLSIVKGPLGPTIETILIASARLSLFDTSPDKDFIASIITLPDPIHEQQIPMDSSNLVLYELINN